MWCCRPCPHRFLSTPSARRATREIIHAKCATQISIHAFREEGDPFPVYVPTLLEISIHALREEGDRAALSAFNQQGISIHALREEGDLAGFVDLSGYVEFLSTPSARRATWQSS